GGLSAAFGDGVPARLANTNLRTVRPGEALLCPRLEYLFLTPLNVGQGPFLAALAKLLFAEATNENSAIQILPVNGNEIRLAWRLYQRLQKFLFDSSLCRLLWG